MKGKCSVCGKDAEIWAIPGHFGSYSYGSCDECIITVLLPDLRRRICKIRC